MYEIDSELFAIPKGISCLFHKSGMPEVVASLILGKALVLSKKTGSCVMPDSFINSMLPGSLSRAQIQRALAVLKKHNLIKVGRTGVNMHGSRIISPNFDAIVSQQRSQNDTTRRSQNVATERSQNDTSMIPKQSINDPKTDHQRSQNVATNNIRDIRNIRIYIERFLLKFYKNNLDQLFKDKDVFRCDLAEAKKTIPFDGGPYEALTDWIYTNIKEWARELLCCKYFYHDHAGRCEFNLEPVLDYALGHYDPSKGVHFLDYFQTVILNNCKILFRKYRDGEDNYIETFGRLFDRLMLQKWLFQKDEKMKLTPTWAEAHYFAFDDKALRKIRRHCREGYDFSGYDIIAKKYIGTKELIIIINAWFIHFCLYRFRYHNDMHDTWRDLFKFTKNEDVFLNASDKEMLEYFASIWGVFNKAYTQFKLPAVTLDETLDAIFREGE
ncbi:hypothetical protein [Anaerobiospirillum thomasii]|uniref:Uncharacterized protein n=1 Tax=Anaerobiospirillum thomasii TaxID=179995 RepID=A0A2X0VB91_9GAMM|nr:hypothetical protein [Anaerobiospirillum thomasii]SPT70075.1 Uncharacterised protein [Anaerobiospirillum thomasii]